MLIQNDDGRDMANALTQAAHFSLLQAVGQVPDSQMKDGPSNFGGGLGPCVV